MARVVHWNGHDLPEELTELPAGRYVLEPVDELPELTPDEEDGLIAALASLRAGKGRSPEDVRAAVSRALKR
jgi:hypothetical protein